MRNLLRMDGWLSLGLEGVSFSDAPPPLSEEVDKIPQAQMSLSSAMDIDVFCPVPIPPQQRPAVGKEWNNVNSAALLEAHINTSRSTHSIQRGRVVAKVADYALQSVVHRRLAALSWSPDNRIVLATGSSISLFIPRPKSAYQCITMYRKKLGESEENAQASMSAFIGLTKLESRDILREQSSTRTLSRGFIHGALNQFPATSRVHIAPYSPNGLLIVAGMDVEQNAYCFLESRAGMHHEFWSYPSRIDTNPGPPGSISEDEWLKSRSTHSMAWSDIIDDSFVLARGTGNGTIELILISIPMATESPWKSLGFVKVASSDEWITTLNFVGSSLSLVTGTSKAALSVVTIDLAGKVLNSRTLLEPSNSLNGIHLMALDCQPELAIACISGNTIVLVQNDRVSKSAVRGDCIDIHWLNGSVYYCTRQGKIIMLDTSDLDSSTVIYSAFDEISEFDSEALVDGFSISPDGLVGVISVWTKDGSRMLLGQLLTFPLHTVNETCNTISRAQSVFPINLRSCILSNHLNVFIDKALHFEDVFVKSTSGSECLWESVIVNRSLLNRASSIYQCCLLQLLTPQTQILEIKAKVHCITTILIMGERFLQLQIAQRDSSSRDSYRLACWFSHVFTNPSTRDIYKANLDGSLLALLLQVLQSMEQSHPAILPALQGICHLEPPDSETSLNFSISPMSFSSECLETEIESDETCHYCQYRIFMYIHTLFLHLI